MCSAGGGEKFILSTAKINQDKTCPNREQYDAHRTRTFSVCRVYKTAKNDQMQLPIWI